MGCLSPSWSSLSSASRLSTPHATCSRGAPCEQPSGVAGRLNRLRLQRQHYAGGLMFVGAPVVQLSASCPRSSSISTESARALGFLPLRARDRALDVLRLALHVRSHDMYVRIPSGFACAVACASGCPCYCMCVHAHVHTHTFSGLHPHAHRACTCTHVHMPMHVRMRIHM